MASDMKSAGKHDLGNLNCLSREASLRPSVASGEGGAEWDAHGIAPESNHTSIRSFTRSIFVEHEEHLRNTESTYGRCISKSPSSSIGQLFVSINVNSAGVKTSLEFLAAFWYKSSISSSP